jgi:outer membrane receptor protein involved in Fe transport
VPYRFLLVLALVLGWSYEAGAEPFAGRVISGQTLAPVAGAELIAGEGKSARSDSQGYFRFRDLPRGRFRLRVKADGFEIANERIVLSKGGILDQTIVLLSLETSGEIIEIHAKKTAPKRVPPGKQELTREEIMRIPGTRGDALQSIRSLPGVGNSTAVGSGPGITVIRGAAPEDSKVNIDGIQVPLLYHFFGFQSIMPSEFIESIEFLPGGFGAEEGNVTGGVINVKSRRIESDETKAFAEVSFINLAGMIQGPISKKHNLHYAVAARRSLIDVVLPLALPDDVNLSFVAAPVYYDAQLRVDWRPKYTDRVSLFFFGSSDEMSLLNDEITPNEPEIQGSIANSTRFFRPILSWTHETETFESRLSGSMGAGNFHINVGPERYFDFTGSSGQFRSDQSWSPSKRFTARAGLEYLYRGADIDSRFPLPPNEGSGGIPNFSTSPLIEVDEHFSNNAGGGYMTVDLRPGKNTTVSPGIRLDYYSRFDAAAWGPRLAVQHRLTTKALARFAMGSYSRSAQQAESFTTTLRPEKATQYVLGTEYDFTPGIKLQASTYYTDRRDLIGQDPVLAQMDPKDSYINIAYGRSMGVEGTLRARLDDFFGWVTYTLSKSDRIDTPLGKRRLFDYDQTHNFVALGSYTYGKWQFGSRFQYSTGRPLTPVVGSQFLSDLNIYLPTLGAINSARSASDHQIDIRVDRKWKFDTWDLDLYLDITNVYANAKLIGYSYNFDYSEREEISEVPFLPALGVRGSF